MTDKQFRMRVLSELKEIRQEIRDLKKTCSKMDNHVEFVESVYETVRAPVSWILSKVPGRSSLMLSHLSRVEEKRKE